jgi:hypothetical protein
MFKLAATLLALNFFVSCTGARDPGATKHGYAVSFDENWYVTIEVPFEEAWEITLSALQDQQFPVEAQDRVSLTITTQYVSIGTNQHVGHCPFRTKFSPFSAPGTQSGISEMRCRLVVRPVPLGEITTKVRVLAAVQAKLNIFEKTRDGSHKWRTTDWMDCESVGQIEKQFLDAFLTRLEPINYDPPTYRRRR